MSSRNHPQYNTGTSQSHGRGRTSAHRHAEQILGQRTATPADQHSAWLFSQQPDPSTQRQGNLQGPGVPILGASALYSSGTTSEQLQEAQAQLYQDWIDAFDNSQQTSRTLQPQRSNMDGDGMTGQFSLYSNSFPTSNPLPTGSTAGAAFTGTQAVDNYDQFYDRLLGISDASIAPTSPPTTNLRRFSPESTLHSYTGTPEPTYSSQPQQPIFQPHPQGHRPMYPDQISSSQRPHRESTQQFGGQQYLGQSNPSYSDTPDSLSANLHASSTRTSPRHSTFVSDGLGAQAHPAMTPSASKPPRARPHGLTETAPTRASGKRKRAKPSENERGEDSDDDETADEENERAGGTRGGMSSHKEGKNDKASRLPGACAHCKKLKMKCDFPRGAETCKRCKAGGHPCIVEGRKPRTAPNKREYLLAQIRQKDSIIESLLKQLHNPYAATPLSIASYRMATSPSDQNKGNVLAWLDRLQSSVNEANSKGGENLYGEPRMQKKEESEPENLGTIDLTESEAEDDDEGKEGNDGEAEGGKTTLPDSHVPLGLIANLSLNQSKNAMKRKHVKGKNVVGLSEEDLNDNNLGVANDTYFMPGPATDLGIRATMIEQHSPPEILVHGLVTPDDVEKLFDLFFKKVNPFISLLDPTLHTPAATFARCPFLFTVVCAVASRFYTEKSEIYPIAMHFAKHSAATALIDGWKSVELCQAYILMSTYSVPARRWEEDRSWLYIGLAIRIATDLNLHQLPTTKPTSEKQERELLNQTRAWMNCFNLDRSTATQCGKPSTIKEDFFSRIAKDWYKQSKFNIPYDLHLCAYSELLQIVSKFHEEIFSDPSSPTGLNKNVDFHSMTMDHDKILTDFHSEWSKRFKEESDVDNPGCVFRCLLLPFVVSYSRLVMFSFGFQQAFRRGFQPSDDVFFKTCYDSAKTVIETMIHSLADTDYMKYAPDGHFVFATFASAFLLKLLRPEFAKLLNKEQQEEVFDLIGGLIQTLGSNNIAIDDRHTPKLYARFLAGLLAQHRRDGATVGRLQTLPASLQPAAQSGPSSSMTTFSVTSRGHGQAMASTSRGGGYSQLPFQPTMMEQDTPIYMQEATFASGTGQISFGSGFEAYSSPGSEDDTLAPMQALKNPAWWQDLMMPGFSWPEASPSPPGAQTFSSSTQQQPGMVPGPSMPGMSGTFGMFHTTPISLH